MIRFADTNNYPIASGAMCHGIPDIRFVSNFNVANARLTIFVRWAMSKGRN